MITIKCTTTNDKTKKSLEKMKTAIEKSKNLDRYGEMGVEALAAATPIRSGLTASSWSYEIVRDESGVRIVWSNSNLNQGVNIAVLIQMGHGTGYGGYVEGIDYINPALKPIFEKIADDAWKEVCKS